MKLPLTTVRRGIAIATALAGVFICAPGVGQAQGLFKLDWAEPQQPDTVRVACGDTVGDGKARLIVLQQLGGHGSITINKWDGQAWKQEYTTGVPGPADKLAVGKFASAARAVIATPGALIYYSGTAYARAPSPEPVDIVGSVTLNDGTDHLLVKLAGAMKMATVNPLTNGSWLVDPTDPPGSGAAQFTEMRAPQDELTSLGIPLALAEGGVVGVWTLPSAKKLALYRVQIIAQTDVDKKSDTNTKVVLKGVETYLQVVDPKTPGFHTLWRSARIEGRVLDVARGDPRTGADGLMVLSKPTNDGPPLLTFYKLQ